MIDRNDDGLYIGGMKVKTSVTLSQQVLKDIDRHIQGYTSRSEFIEAATRSFIVELEQKKIGQRDLELINQYAESLNSEAEDVLGYQLLFSS